ncbi:FAD-dependent monooxygenase [Streptomyces sp. CB01881]|uniref:FAD-dependent monooxygenase n=1 Tax=Streptomyces sp. CB01881 TaxID=2078691 RepID=UPI000CDBE0B6|nr:FAD-dependent monooxygenase [Streptomyces sp. CB01881]AUY52702.1 monooxygenase [Streptomyces sp. CB01881]TYC70420.1 monooxygenase [Streptomyces sp. CB01881]
MSASVVIAGAGPAGLVLAGELRLAGIDVVVLERLSRRTVESRGIGLTIRTVETFAQRGLLRRFGDLGTSDQGHFGGVPVDLGVLGGAYRAAKTVPQSVTETVLENWAVELGADIRRGHEFRSYREEGASVLVRVGTPAGERTLRADYLVGADGGRSTVRKAGGFDFPGSAATTELLLADVRGIDVRPRMTGELLSDGMVMSAPLPGGVHRVIVGERGAAPRRRGGPPTYQEVADTWKRLTGDDISHAEPVWVSAFTDAARLVSQYRRGRVLLTGDAAHIHLPAGGQGMNTGIQDSVNLGWKLAAVLHGTAPESLLDTYHDERHEVGRQLLADTAAQGRLILGGAQAQPLRDVLAELTGYQDVSRHLAAKVSGLAIRYDVGPGANPLLGARLPHLELTVRGRAVGSTALLRAGRGVLLDLADNPHLRRRAAPWRERIDIVTATPHGGGTPLDGTTAVLVRPDGYVAWAGPGSHHDLPTALDRWFGPARRESRER